MKQETHSVGMLTVLLVCLSFAGCLLLVLAYGASSYQRTADSAALSYGERTGLSYVTAKVRAADAAGQVYAGRFGEEDALYFIEEYGGARYQTVLYAYDGWLCEMFSAEGLQFDPASGERILEAERFVVSQEEQLLSIQLVDSSGVGGQAQICLRSGGGV